METAGSVGESQEVSLWRWLSAGETLEFMGLTQMTHGFYQDTSMRELLVVNLHRETEQGFKVRAGHLNTMCRCGVSQRELFAYGDCGPAVSTSHLTSPR